jgi:hypothetical protein
MQIIPLAFAKNGVSLNQFSMITTVGTPIVTTEWQARLAPLRAD